MKNLIATVLTSFSVAVVAQPILGSQQPSSERVWEKEPEAFLGVRLGEPFAVLACPMKALPSKFVRIESIDYDVVMKMDGVCFHPSSEISRLPKGNAPGDYRLVNVPQIGVGYKAYVRVKSGVSEKIFLELAQPDFAVLLDAFTQRYGPPTNVELGVAKNLAGAQMGSQTVQWLGRKLSIRMYERLTKMNESYVEISNNEIESADRASTRAKRATEVQKF